MHSLNVTCKKYNQTNVYDPLFISFNNTIYHSRFGWLSVFNICWFHISNLIKSYKIKTKIFHVVFSNDQAHRHLTLYIFLMIKIYTLNLYASLDIGFIFLLWEKFVMSGACDEAVQNLKIWYVLFSNNNAVVPHRPKSLGPSPRYRTSMWRG